MGRAAQRWARRRQFLQLKNDKYPDFPEELTFLHAEDIQAILHDEIPLSIGGGIGQSRTYMYLLRKAHLGEMSVTVWPKILTEMCARKNIHVLK